MMRPILLISLWCIILILGAQAIWPLWSEAQMGGPGQPLSLPTPTFTSIDIRADLPSIPELLKGLLRLILRVIMELAGGLLQPIIDFLNEPVEKPSATFDLEPTVDLGALFNIQAFLQQILPFLGESPVVNVNIRL